MKNAGYCLILGLILCFYLSGCGAIHTDFTKKAVLADASLWGCNLQTGFDPVSGTPLPKLEFGKIDATYVSIPCGEGAGTVEISIGSEGDLPNVESAGISRKISIKVQREQPN